eukprot:CAMPEP_0119409578 /NCGR_PEP_ID=MMETSP1335-20130426/2838_1 /TAXON_ID=259385 /ORGANISM="Chrysoculter rhomboideus, Strain RCC1486" /LENGTH=119 /DNA_ID=CAMNT_0007433975 /DNA_START=161 /DNA_END=517 /DNA_ORIENTATION=-
MAGLHRERHLELEAQLARDAVVSRHVLLGQSVAAEQFARLISEMCLLNPQALKPHGSHSFQQTLDQPRWDAEDREAGGAQHSPLLSHDNESQPPRPFAGSVGDDSSPEGAPPSSTTIST